MKFIVEYHWKDFTLREVFSSLTEANHFISTYTIDGKVVAIEVQDKKKTMQIFNVR